MGILWVLKSIFSLSIKAYFLYKGSKIVFHDLLSLFITLGCRRLQGVTGGYRGLQEVTLEDYKASQRVTRGYRGLEGSHRVIGAYKALQKTFSVSRTSPDTFSWTILHKKQSWRNLKLLTKTMDLPPWKNPKFVFFLKICSYCLLRLLYYLNRQ